MLREVNIKNTLAKPTIRIDRMVLREFAEFASQLGFESPEITKLREHLHPIAVTYFLLSKYLLVENGPGEPKKRRYGLSDRETYTKDRTFLYLYNIHKKDEVDEGITSFFV